MCILDRCGDVLAGLCWDGMGARKAPRIGGWVVEDWRGQGRAEGVRAWLGRVGQDRADEGGGGWVDRCWVAPHAGCIAQHLAVQTRTAVGSRVGRVVYWGRRQICRALTAKRHSLRGRRGVASIISMMCLCPRSFVVVVVEAVNVCVCTNTDTMLPRNTALSVSS